MTAENDKEGAAESATTNVASDPDQQGESDIEEGKGDVDNLEVHTILEERSVEDEQSHRGEEKRVIEQHGETESYRESKEEDDCPFCFYMKSGACGQTFADWEECINEGERTGEDIVEKCVRVTRLLTQCMRDNADYYGPVLGAEKVMAASVASVKGLDEPLAQAERTYREAVEVGTQKLAQETEG